jgi:hypothetical protein
LVGEMRQRRAVVAMPAPRTQRWAIGGIAGLAAAALISVVLLRGEILNRVGVRLPDGSTQTTGATAQGSEATVQVAPASGNVDASSAAAAAAAANDSSGEDAAAQDADAEYATSYFALPSAEGANFAEDQTIVRVSLPPSALASFGLPFSSGDRDGNVLADFVLGEDGMPRAVRLVE